MRLDPAHPFKRDPLPPHELAERFTTTPHILCHLSVPRFEPGEWRLTIDGLVERPRELGLDELRRYPRVELAAVHQCCGSPLAPFEPTRRVSQVRWGGVRLSHLLAEARPRPGARFLWSSGADSGELAGVRADAYVKDLPLERVAQDVLLAYEMNGAPLLAEHGSPVRLFVPGFYGTNSVKWLTRLSLMERRATGPFTTRFYNDPVLDAEGRETGDTTPVWAIAPESLIVTPRADARLERGTAHEIAGWAWADGGARRVDVRTDTGWQRAELEPSSGYTWQRFTIRWRPERPGRVVLAARAEATSGEQQPRAGRRNAWHEVAVDVA